MATIRYTTYNFSQPLPLQEKDYEILKSVLVENPDYNLNPPASFIETFKGELVILGLGVFGSMLMAIDLAKWLSGVGGFFTVIAIFSLFSFVPSAASYLEFMRQKSSYYSKLKKDILKTQNYSDFKNIRKNSELLGFY